MDGPQDMHHTVFSQLAGDFEQQSWLHMEKTFILLFTVTFFEIKWGVDTHPAFH